MQTRNKRSEDHSDRHLISDWIQLKQIVSNGKGPPTQLEESEWQKERQKITVSFMPGT